MPVGFNSPARNLFLLGSSGTQIITNFFRAVDQSAGTDGVYIPDEIKYDITDQKYVLAGSAEDSNSKGFGWFEKRNVGGSADWDVRVEHGSGVNTTLRSLDLDTANNLIVVGKTGNIPWITKYSNSGVIDWQSTTNSGDVEYTGIASDINGNYYACGSTPISGQAQAFVEKFDGSGNPGWGKSAFMLGRDVVLNRIAANSRGEVVAVGYLEDDISHKGYIIKIDANTGEVLWDRTLTSTHNSGGLTPYKDVVCNDVYIDINDQIYIVGNQDTTGFIIKYTAEGNIIWQKQTPNSSSNFYFDQVKSDGETEQTVVLGRYHNGVGDEDGLLTKYSKNGDLVWRRIITSSRTSGLQFSSVNLDADPSFYYLLFVDQPVDGLNGTPDSYTFGKVSTSGNGLGSFEYFSDGSTTIDYQILNVQDEIGRVSDGSVRNDSSDLITYPFNANNLLFDDLATQVTNKKRQMDGPDSFEYSGSPAIRPADFQELNFGDEKIDVTELVNGIPTGQVEYTSSGTYSWTAPADVTSVSVVAVGGGGGGAPWSGNGGIGAYGSGGGGGGLGWKNNISVTPGQTYTVVVGAGGTGSTSPTAGGDSYFINTSTVKGGGGDFGDTSTTSTGGTFTGDGGGNGGNGAYADGGGGAYGGGGGAGGYSGNGGSAAVNGGSHGNGSGGGGGGGFSSGGGVGIYGEGANGTGGFNATGGSGGTAGQTYTTGSDGGVYGGGGGCSDNSPGFTGGDGGSGAVRIIWGDGRAFPSTLTADQTPSAGGLVEQIITKAKDKSGKGNNGVVNGATLNVAGYWEFDGTDGDQMRITLDKPIIPATGPWTAEGWVYLNNTNVVKMFMTQYQSGSDVGRFQLFFAPDGTIRMQDGNGIMTGSLGDCPTYSANTWTHVVWQHNDNNENMIYVNGVKATSEDQQTTTSLLQVDTLIGSRYDLTSGVNFNGRIGEVRVYPRALTAAQVFQNYNATREKYTGVPASTDPGLTSTRTPA